MHKKHLYIFLIVALMALLTAQFWPVFLPKQLDHTVNRYFEEHSFHKNDKFIIHQDADWLSGELALVENDEMIGLVYLEKQFGLYKVINHVLCNKTDNLKDDLMKDLDYQYRLLMARSFVDNQDILMAYINDEEIKTFELDGGLDEFTFSLKDGRKVFISIIEDSHSIIKTKSKTIDERVIKWTEDNLQDFIKYDADKFVYSSEKPLNLGLVGDFYLQTDDSISLNNLALNDLENLASDDYDGLIINTRISNDEIEDLISENWTLFLMYPNRNLENKKLFNVDEETLIIEKSKHSSGRSSRSKLYDLESNYFIAFSIIFERLSMDKD